MQKKLLSVFSLLCLLSTQYPVFAVEQAVTTRSEQNSKAGDVYYSTATQNTNGKSFDRFNVDIETEKNISLQGLDCQDCASYSFTYDPVMSEAIGKNTYVIKNIGRFLIAQEKGVLILTNSRLGQALWSDRYSFNVFAQDPAYIEKLKLDKAEQAKVVQIMQDHTQQAKSAIEARYAKLNNQSTTDIKLPPQGLRNSALHKQVLTAAEDLSEKEGWGQFILEAYISGNEWTIVHNDLSDVPSGRRIPGVIIMKNNIDGLCSFQLVQFFQPYKNGNYYAATIESIDTAQQRLNCSKARS